MGCVGSSLSSDVSNYLSYARARVWRLTARCVESDDPTQVARSGSRPSRVFRGHARTREGSGRYLCPLTEFRESYARARGAIRRTVVASRYNTRVRATEGTDVMQRLTSQPIYQLIGTTHMSLIPERDSPQPEAS